jgi:hypothetical protein
MDMKRPIERELGSLTFASNQTSTLQLPRDYSLAKLKFRLVADMDRTAVGGSVNRELSGSQLVKRIEVRRNGRDVLKSIDFTTLMRQNEIDYKVPAARIVSTTTWDSTPAGAEDDTTFNMGAILDFAMQRSIRQNDTLLDCTARGNVSTLDLIITWAAGADCVSTGVITVNSCTLYVSTLEYIDIDSKDDPYTPYADFKVYGIRKTVAASNPKEQIELGVGNFYRGFLIKTHVASVMSNTIINSITLKSGTDVIKYRYGLGLRNDMKSELNITTLPDGYYWLELCPDGHLAKMLDTTNMSSLTLELDTTITASTVIEVFPHEIVPAARRAA